MVRNIVVSILFLSLAGALYAQDCTRANLRCVGAGKEYTAIQPAADDAQPGDTVLVFPGRYVGFNTVRSGTSVAPIVYKAAGSFALGDSVIIDQKCPKPVVTHLDSFVRGNIQIRNTDYTVIDGFVVEKNQERAGINAIYSKGVIIKNNLSRLNARWNIFTGWSPILQVVNNICHTTTQGTNSPRGPEHGIYVSNSNVANDSVLIRGNICYGNAGSGIQVNGDCFYPDSNGVTDGQINNARVENNILYNNRVKGFSLAGMANSVVINNLTYNNADGSYGAAGIHLASEPDCPEGASDNIVANNTVVESRMPGIKVTDFSANNVIFNNLVLAPYNSDRECACADWVGSSFFDSNFCLVYSTTVMNSHFVNPTGLDFHLKQTSTAINRGVASDRGKNAPGVDLEGKARPAGGRFDLGAYEYGAISFLEQLELAFTGLLLKASPNPFRTMASLSFAMPEGYYTGRLEIFTMDGRQLRAWDLAAAQGTIVWAGDDGRGRSAAPGIYVARLTAGAAAKSCRILKVR